MAKENSILNELGISQEDLDNAQTSVIGKQFEPLTSGVYAATIGNITVYTNRWETSTMRYEVAVADDNGEQRTLTFTTDVGKTLKDGKANPGYAGRLEQFAYASGTDLASISLGQATKINSFGEEFDGKLLVGMNGKKVKALVKLIDDMSKQEGEPYKFMNFIQGVIHSNGTEKSGENVEEKFNEMISKTPVFIQKKKKAAKEKLTDTAKTASGTAIADLL